MSNFFEKNKSEGEIKKYLSPDYTNAKVDEADDICDDIVEEDEGKLEAILDRELEKDDYRDSKKEVKTMSFNSNNTPFGNPITTTPSWNSPSLGSSSGSGSSFWEDKPAKTTTTPSWSTGGGFSSGNWNQNNQKPSTPSGGIDRNKRVLICDFLDCLVETWQSGGQPGLTPRDIYDIKPRIQVWERLAVFNPDRIYAIIPVNLIPNCSNGTEGLSITLEYFCCCISAFMRLPYQNCQILAQSQVGQPKSDVISSLINQPGFEIPKNDIIYIGINSGNTASQSDIDKRAADICGIDYLDLGELLRL